MHNKFDPLRRAGFARSCITKSFESVASLVNRMGSVRVQRGLLLRVNTNTQAGRRPRGPRYEVSYRYLPVRPCVVFHHNSCKRFYLLTRPGAVDALAGVPSLRKFKPVLMRSLKPASNSATRAFDANSRPQPRTEQ